MTGPELRATLALLDLSQMAAARLLVVDPTTVRRWIAGKRAIPESAALALRLMLKHGEAPEGWTK